MESDDINSNKGTINNGQAKQKSKPNIFSRLFLWWMCPVLITGNRRDVVEDDLIVPSGKYKSERVGDYFEKYWFDEVERASRENREPSLWKALRRAYWLSYMPGAIYVIIMCALRTYQPLLFARLLSYWSVDGDIDRLEAGLYALAMLGINFVTMMCNHHNSLFVMRFSLKIKVACSSLLYRKLLRTSLQAAGDVAGGRLVNLLSNDMIRFDYVFMFLHYLWVVPIQMAAVLYLLYDVAGYAPYVGLFGVILIIFPLQAGLTKLTAVVRRETAQRTDSRIKLMSEIINGIQVIKMYAWEKPFELVVQAARVFEMKSLRKSIFIRNTFLGFMLFTDRSILLFTILTLALTGNMITATLIYPIQQYFSVLQMNVTMILPLAIASLSEMVVSLERMQSFLLLDEREDMSKSTDKKGGNIVTFNGKVEKNGEPGIIYPKKYSQHEILPMKESTSSDGSGFEYPIELKQMSASWTGSNDEMTLKNITLRIGKGKLCAVIGPVGSGKSSLLQVIMKELSICDGSLSVKGSVSYACQESWLFPATVRENILFGVPYNSKKYKEVCKACCLGPDFKQFPYGDLSLVGERGVSLSGGQRARINLARAIYQEADIYLLDDPLSAVDANVGRLLFEGCVKGYLRGRTCILVTHQIHFLKASDHIVVLNEGGIENMGTYDELVDSGTEFSLLLPEKGEESSDVKGEFKKTDILRGISKISAKSEDAENEQTAQVLEAEERAKGGLKWSVIFEYLRSVQSWAIVLLAFIALLVTQALVTTADYWISYWTNQVDAYEQSLPEGLDPDTSMDTQTGLLTTAQYLYVYGGVILAIILFANVRIVSFVIMTMRASQNLHNKIYQKLIIAVMRFFDTNPSGRVLNRFSKDMGAMDELLPRSLLETVQMYLSLTSILVLNATALPWTLIPTFVLMVVFIILLKWYLNTAQAVKRLEGTTKSPVFGMINSTISGLSTIRCSNSQDRLLRTFDDAQNLNTSAYYTFLGGSTAFGLYLDCLCLIYLAVIMTIFLVIDFSTLIPVGSVGLAVSQSMVLTMMLQMAARFTADFLGQMTAVERVLEYTNLPTEENMTSGPKVPPKDWPKQGNVKFENVFLNYGPEDPPVLKNLNFEIQSGWKVGVVGRTGAGKSSLIAALFRLYNIDGSIKIDDIDTFELSKLDLRSKISIIPQEPVLFSATIRYNLDPFDDFKDDDIWRALEQVELKDVIPALDYKVSEGGSNFSIGQRQLVCLARAVLRSNKILVMDEATANVDPQTDGLIQKTIRREFLSCTVITIAHRLNTIMDSDRVLVMDKGEAVEFDYPYKLLSNPNSHLSFMVNETGESMKRILFEIAKTKYFNDNPQLIFLVNPTC